MVGPEMIAVIPARGGSKRIPRKNIIDFQGKPMIAWTIEAALLSGCFKRVIVSTDDEEIATISRHHGAEVPFLRDANADNHSPVSLATLRTLAQLNDTESYVPEVVVQLMANCPLRSADDIKAAVTNFMATGSDFQISCFKYGWMNPWWAHQINDHGIAQPVFSETERSKRSQDQPDLYCPTGAIWIAKTEKIIEAGSFYGKDYTFFPMTCWISAIDIDDYEDLKMAALLQPGL